MIPLRYLGGALYINFKLLWDLILRIIETQAHGLEIGEFWGVFREELEWVVHNIRGREGGERSGCVGDEVGFFEGVV